MLTINKKLLLRLFIGLVLFSGSLFLVHYVQSDRVTDALRWQADHAAEIGKLDKAILYMQQYLELRPDDHEAATKLAEMILQKGSGSKQLTSAMFLYERVLREAPQREDVRRKLMDLALRLNRHGDAQIHVKALLEKSPNESDLWHKLGVCQIGQNKLDEARTSLERAVTADPQNIRACELLVDLLVRQMNLADTGREWLDKLVRANPLKAEAYLVRANFWRSREKTAECQADLEHALKIDPENANGLLMLAEIVHNKGEAQQARIMLVKGMARHPKDVRFYRMLSWLELTHGNLAAGIDCLEKGVRELPAAFELLMPLGDLLVQQGEVDKAREVVRKLEGQRGFANQTRYLRGRLLMVDGRWSDAAAMLENLRTEVVANAGFSAQVNWLLAQSQERLGNRDNQMESLKRVLAIEPGHLNARLKFGSMHLAGGRFEEGIKEYTVAARSPYAPLSARVTLGRLMIARARSSGTKDDWHITSEYVEALRKKYPNTVDPVLLAAEMNLYQRKHDVARKLLRDETGRKLNDSRLWSALSAIELDGAGLHAALEVLDEAQSILGDTAELRLARARAWSNDWQTGREGRIRAQAKGVENLPDAEQIRLLASLADICASIRDYEGVKELQTLIASRLPMDVSLRRLLLANAIRTGDAKLVAQVRSELQTLQKPGDDILAVAEALSSADEWKPDDARFQEAHSLMRRLLTAFPDRGDVRALAAVLAEKAGDIRSAAMHYDAAVEIEPTNLAYLQGQLVTRIRMGADMKPRFEQMLGDPRLSWEGFRAIVEYAFTKLTEEQFENCMLALTPSMRKSGSMLLWAAQLEKSRGRETQALVLVQQACALTPKLADAWIARIRLQPKEAAKILDAARPQLEDRAYFLICAESAEAIRTVQANWAPTLSNTGQQRLLAKASMSVHAIRGQHREAADVLRKLASDPKASAADVAWAKRTSTMLAAATGNAAERRQALIALREWKPNADTALDESRTHAASLAIAARHLYGNERKLLLQQAVDTMKIVTAAKEATSKDWYHLSQCQGLVSDRAGQLASLRKAMENDETNLFYVVAYVEDQLAEGKQSELEPLIARLQAAINDPRAAATAAKFHCLANAPERVLEVVEKYERGTDPGTPEGLARQRQAAEMLDQSGRLAAAKGLSCGKTIVTAALDKYRLGLKTFPETAGPMAALLAFNGNVQPAYDLLTQMKSSLSLQALTAAAMSVIRSGNSTPKHFQIVRGWIDEALVQDAKNWTLKLSLAELLAIKQDYAAAEPIYREAIKAEPDNVIALNNLAWILSPRADATEEAMKCVDRAIEISGPTGELLDTRARIHISRGNYDRALEDLNQALQQGQTSLRWFHLAVAQFKQLKKEEAVRSFKEARARGIDARLVHPDDLPMYKVMESQMQ